MVGLIERKRAALTQAEVKRLFHYDPETGLFHWRVTVSNRAPEGSRAGVRTKVGKDGAHGYVMLCVDWVKYPAHCVAWLYMTGEWPANEVDHINRVRHDNRWSNLREATRTQQLQNTTIRSDNSTGVKGVAWDKTRDKWQAYISIDGKRVPLGRFGSFEDAATARKNAEVKYFGDYVSI